MKLITDLVAARAVVPRAAATTLVLRDGTAGLEVLMVRRSMQASFMPGAYVFPGGAVDAADGSAECAALCDEEAGALAHRIGTVMQVGDAALAFAVAALRECYEECGLWLSGTGTGAVPDALQLQSQRARLHGGEGLAALAREAGWALHTSALLPWSHWMTPLGLPKRFDTLFFVARAPSGQAPSVDAGETTTLAWVHPPAALEAHARSEFPMEFATVATLTSLAPFAKRDVAALCAHAAAQRSLPPLQPRLQVGGDGQRVSILLPDQPGYDEATLQ
jgi:8-oxo-dGTP pyrophosphatase MutT (NUDIX family)